MSPPSRYLLERRRLPQPILESSSAVPLVVVGTMLLSGCGSGAPAHRATDAAVADLVGDRDSGADSADAARASHVETRVFSLARQRELDLMFVVDDSSAMAGLQGLLAQALPTLINVLQQGPGGLPNLHAGVVSSSLGAGIFDNVPGCGPGTAGNLNGEFRRPAACTQLASTATYLSSVIAPGADPTARVNNFTGDIAAALGCLVKLGAAGCGFPHPLEAARFALERSFSFSDPENGGFLRRDAHLAVVIFSNGDDCSVPVDSALFDPAQRSVANELGGLSNYRCNEFGHRCQGANPPHLAPSTPQTLIGCVSATDGPLTSVSAYVQFLNSLKSAIDDRIVAAIIAGPPAPYRVEATTVTLPTGLTEQQPAVAHSCGTASQFASPAVRLNDWVRAFGANGVNESICAPDFGPAMNTLGQLILRQMGNRCIEHAVLPRPDGTPDCVVVQRTLIDTGLSDRVVPVCDAARSTVPCWRLTPSPGQCPTGQSALEFCPDAACAAAAVSTQKSDLLVSCSIDLPD